MPQPETTQRPKPLSKDAITECYWACKQAMKRLGYDAPTLPIGSDLELKRILESAIAKAEGK